MPLTYNHAIVLVEFSLPACADPSPLSFSSRLSPPTPINIPKLASYLHDHPHQPFVHHLLAGFSEGFKIGYTGPRAPQEFPNLPSAKDNPSVIDRNMLKEVSLGHTAGPFLCPPFANFQVYPIGAIPKKHSSEWRTIFHLSYPKHRLTSVNAHIPPEDYSLQYIKVDNAIAILQDLGQNCFMSKLDIKAAFRNIPVHPSDWELLGMKWQGLACISLIWFFPSVCVVPPFSSTSSPQPLSGSFKRSSTSQRLSTFLMTFSSQQPHPEPTVRQPSAMSSTCSLSWTSPSPLAKPFLPLPPWNSWVSS